MNAEPPPYNQLYVRAWTFLCLIVSAIFFGTLLFGQTLLHAGHWLWDLVRYLASPII